MSEAIVTLRKGAGRTLKQGGPWIYDNEIESIMGSFEDGDIVLSSMISTAIRWGGDLSTGSQN